MDGGDNEVGNRGGVCIGCVDVEEGEGGAVVVEL